MTGTKTILLIGRSGRGKSTLANVMVSVENKFKESFGSTSETRKVQSEEFELDLEQEKLKKLETKITSEQSNLDKEDKQLFQKMLQEYLQNKETVRYRIIDTPGIGDTKLKDSEVLDIIAEAVYLVKDGVSQVFFVIDSRFDQSEMATYNLLRTIIFDEYITKHTTVVRTNFADFRSKKRRQEDIELMIKETQEKKVELKSQIDDNEKKIETLSSNSEQYQKLLTETRGLKKELKSTLSEIIESCQERVVHVDNPPVGIRGISNDDSESNKGKRNKSRKKLLDHLSENCQEIPYKPKKLKELSTEIVNYMESKVKLEAELRKLKNSTSSSTKIHIKDNKDKLENIFAESSEIESVVEKDKEYTEDSQEFLLENDSVGIGEITIQLESKKTLLKREIEEKERVIRQKVLKHIFNNYDEVSNELGGDIFLESITEDNKNWGTISQTFADKKLVLEWKSNGFDYQQVQKWVKALGSSFDPKKDVHFCAWLRDEEKLVAERIKELNYVIDDEELKKLRKEYAHWLGKEVDILDQYHQGLLPHEEENYIGKAQEYINKKYPTKEERQNLTKLDISGWNESTWTAKPNWEKLTGELDLSDFPNLEKLDCSYNQLTSLNLTNCPHLTELKCWENELTQIKFPNSPLPLKTFYVWTNHLTEIDWKAFNSESLTNISISNNNFQRQDISLFNYFPNLEELYLGNDIEERLTNKIYNRFTGSVKSWQNLTKLKKLQVEGTYVDDSDLADLPKDLQVISLCKENIIRRLGLNKEETTELRKTNPTNFQKVLSQIVTNYVKLNAGTKETIRNLSEAINISQQLKEEESEDKLVTNFKNLENELRKFSEIWTEIVKEDQKNKAMVAVIPLERLFVIRVNLNKFLKKWGVQDKNNQTELSKLQSPGQFNRFLFDSRSKESKWNEFLADVDKFLDNYHELLGILKQVEVSESGVVNIAFKNLKDKVYVFLNDYDEDGNEEVDINELINEREKFANELSKVEAIVEAIKELEEEVVNYRQGSEDKEETEEIKLIIEKLSNELAEKQETEEFKSKIKEKLPQREIMGIIPLVSLGSRVEQQFLVISQNKKNLLSLFNSGEKQYSLDLVEYKPNKWIKIKKSKDFPQLFSSEERAREKARVIELDRKANKILKELRKKEVKKEGNKEEITEEKKEKLGSLEEQQKIGIGSSSFMVDDTQTNEVVREVETTVLMEVPPKKS